MFDSKELGERVLSELEEWGQENLPTLLNTCCKPEGRAEECRVLGEALAQLYASGFVRFTFSNPEMSNFVIADDSTSKKLLMSLDQHLRFEQEEGYWTGTADPWPEVVATPEGRRRGRDIMDARGYQWWRSKS